MSKNIIFAQENLAAGKSYTYEQPPTHRSAPDPGNRKLTDGVLSSSWNGGTGGIYGWVTLDLGKSQPVRTVMIYCVSYAGIGINYPRQIEVEYTDELEAEIGELAGETKEVLQYKHFGTTTDHLPNRRYETAGWMRVIRKEAVEARLIRIKGGGYFGEIEVYAGLPPVEPRGLYKFSGEVTPLWYEAEQAVDQVRFAIVDARDAGKDVTSHEKQLVEIEREFIQAMESVTGHTTGEEFGVLQEQICGKARTLAEEIKALTGKVIHPMIDPVSVVEKGFLRIHGAHGILGGGDPLPDTQTVLRYVRHGHANAINADIMRDIDLDKPVSKAKLEKIAMLREASAGEGIPFFASFWYNDKRTMNRPWGHPEHLEAYKRVMDFCLDTFGDHPGFAGIYFDEMFGGAGHNKYCLAALRNRLQQYPPEVLKAHGIEDIESAVPPAVPESLTLSEEEFASFTPREKFLWIEFLEAEGDLFHNEMAKVCRHVHDKQPGAKMYILLTPSSMGGDPLGGASLAKMGRIADILGTDLYHDSFHGKAFICSLMDSTATARTVFTPGAHYGNSRLGFNQDLVISMVHNDGIWPFTFNTVFKQHASTSWKNLPSGLWEDTCRLYEKMARLEPYLVNTTCDTPIGMVYSERTEATTHWGMGFKGQFSHYIRSNQLLYRALAVQHIPVEPFFIQLATDDFLKKYKALILCDARSLTDEEIKVITEWVKRGGVLIATASSTIKDRWGILREDYAMNEVFGVKFRKGPVMRRTLRISRVSEALPGIPAGEEIAMQNPIKTQSQFITDLVEPTTGEVIAEWEDSSPAIVMNRYGKGDVTFISAHLPLEWENGNCGRLLASCVSGALTLAKAEIPVKLSGDSGSIYAVVRQQQHQGWSWREYKSWRLPFHCGHNQRILHLVNLSSEKCEGVKACVFAPKARQAKLEPEGRQLTARQVGNYLEFDVPPFALHTAIAVE